MSEVTRVDFSAQYGVEEKPDGDFVHYWEYLSDTQELQQRITELEQQLKTAKVSSINEAIQNAELIKWATDASNNYEGESFDAWKVGFQDCRLSLIEYANNLEGK